MKYLLLTVFLLGFSPVKKVDLSLNLNVGDVYHHNYKMNTDIKQDINGQEMNINLDINSDMSYEVLQKSNSSYEMKVMYKSIAMNMKSPMGSMQFDSKNPGSENVFTKLLNQMIDFELIATINFDGTIADIKNVDAMYKSMFDQFPELPEAQRAQLESQLRQTFGKEALAGNMEMVTAIFPGKKIGEGDTWENKTELKGGMEGTVNNKYTLKELDGSIAIVERESTIESDATEKMVNGMPAIYNLKGTMNSTLKVDVNTGWIQEGNISQSMGGMVEIKDNPQVPGGLTFPMEMISKTEITN
jgi:hypothetical protein